MKKNINVIANQTIFDIALQEYGSVESLFDLIAENSKEGINANVEPDEVMVIDSENILVKPVVDLYIRESIKPATGGVDVTLPTGDAFTIGFTIGFES